MLKLHKSSFKSLVKQNGIRLGSDVSQGHFEDVFNPHNSFAELPVEVKILLYEYYIHKIKHKEIEKQQKTIKALSDFLRKTAKISSEDELGQINQLID